jgi:ubiquinol-cytochrome c reductase cytochrome c1 subunit
MRQPSAGPEFERTANQDNLMLQPTRSADGVWPCAKVPRTVRAAARLTVARSRGADWLYTYLRTFYPDNSRPTGWNNVAFPSVGMPHVLYGVQGTRPLTVVEVSEVRDDKTGALTGFQRLTSTYDLRGERVNKLEKLAGSNHHSSITYSWGEPVGGQMSTQQYDGLIADLVNYLVYMGEPSGNSRVKIGIYTMLFLLLFIAVTWSLKRIYWKDVH